MGEENKQARIVEELIYKGLLGESQTIQNLSTPKPRPQPETTQDTGSKK